MEWKIAAPNWDTSYLCLWHFCDNFWMYVTGFSNIEKGKYCCQLCGKKAPEDLITQFLLLSE